MEQNLNRTLQGVELDESEEVVEEHANDEEPDRPAGGRMHDEDPY